MFAISINKSKLVKKSGLLKEASTNLVFLAICQLINYIVPVVLTPFFITNIGIEKYGQICIIQAVMFYSVMIVNYGFNSSGPIEIVNRKNLDNSIIFLSITKVKVLLAFLASSFSFLLLLYYGLSVNEFLLIFSSFLFYLLGTALLPEWYFHGIQKLIYLFIPIAIWKILYVLAMIFFIKTRNDYLYILSIDSVILFFVALVTFVFVVIKFQMSRSTIGMTEVKRQLKQNWFLFSSNILTVTYIKGGFLFLGVFASSTAVANFSIAEKYVFIINGLLSLLNRVSLPYLSLIRAKKTVEYTIIIKRLLLTCTIIGTIIFIFSVCFSSHISGWLSAGKNHDVDILIIILSSGFITSSLCSFSTSILIVENMSKEVNKINIIGLIVGIIVVIPLTFFFKEFGLATGITLNSLILALLCIKKIKSLNERNLSSLPQQ